MDAVVTLKVRPNEFDLLRSSLQESLLLANKIVQNGRQHGGHSMSEIRDARERATLLTSLLDNLK